MDEVDGCRLEGKNLWGTYLHGLFDEPEFRRHYLGDLRRRFNLPEPPPGSDPAGSDPYDDLADAVGKHLAVEEMLEEKAWIPSQ